MPTMTIGMVRVARFATVTARRGPGNDDVRLLRDQITDYRLRQLRREARDDAQVLPFDIAALAKRVAERPQQVGGRFRCEVCQIADADAAGLRARGQRPGCRCTADQLDEVAAS
jgi:hypothetical protein